MFNEDGYHSKKDPLIAITILPRAYFHYSKELTRFATCSLWIISDQEIQMPLSYL
jgi:hypothetical protein